MLDSLCNAVTVRYAGRVAEAGPTRAVLDAPDHSCTRALLAAAPYLDGRAAGPSLPGEPPSLRRIPAGCHFHPRCGLATAGCAVTDPPVDAAAPAHHVACHHWRVTG